MRKCPLCLLCHVVSQIPLQRLVGNKLASYGETCVMDFGHNQQLRKTHKLLDGINSVVSDNVGELVSNS